ncbi:MAG: hypothetical protein AB1646_02165 [Thermodesulfobacteriota bacterium]
MHKLYSGYFRYFGNNVSSGRVTVDYMRPFHLSALSVIFGEAHSEAGELWKTLKGSPSNRFDMSVGGGRRHAFSKAAFVGLTQPESASISGLACDNLTPISWTPSGPTTQPAGLHLAYGPATITSWTTFTPPPTISTSWPAYTSVTVSWYNVRIGELIGDVINGITVDSYLNLRYVLARPYNRQSFPVFFMKEPPPRPLDYATGAGLWVWGSPIPESARGDIRQRGWVSLIFHQSIPVR